MSRRSLPSVDSLLKEETCIQLVARYGRPLTLRAVRETLEEERLAWKDGQPPTSMDSLLEKVAAHLSSWVQLDLGPVVNATGVILHTNLGRAPLSSATVAAMGAASGYTALEFDLESGRRGARFQHVEGLLRHLTGAEAALVVNNNAAAVLLVLSALAARRRAVIARSQLVEIGGGFRVPDVMKQSGAKLIEVGTTNRVRLDDYEEALPGSSLVLRAHRSNFKIIGFTEEPSLQAIANLAHRDGLPLVDDLGSGALLDTANYGLAHEPTVQESLAAGADIVCFSGDKLLGGPQAGIILGRAALVARVKRHPLARAVRADKTCLAGLAATLIHYLKDEAEREIPIWQMISASPSLLARRAGAWKRELGRGEVVPLESTVGGGSLPGETLPSKGLALDVPHPDKFLAALRRCQPPVIARTENDRVLLDPRTVLPEQEPALLVALKIALGMLHAKEYTG